TRLLRVPPQNPAERVVREPTGERGTVPEPSQADRHVERAPARLRRVAARCRAAFLSRLGPGDHPQVDQGLAEYCDRAHDAPAVSGTGASSSLRAPVMMATASFMLSS